MSPFSFEIQVSHQIQRHLLQSLPAARGLQHCTSWRSDDLEHRPHRQVLAGVPDHVRAGVPTQSNQTEATYSYGPVTPSRLSSKSQVTRSTPAVTRHNTTICAEGQPGR